MSKVAFFLSIAAAIGSIVIGTAQAEPNDAVPIDAVPIEASADTIETYRLGSGDKLRVTVFNVAEITGDYSISPAGNLALPLIGDIPASGGTTQALAEAIRGRLMVGYVKSPKVSVEVITFRPFYILGEVNRPGEFPFAANMTIEQAVAAAGGYTYRASRKKAYLRRAGGLETVVKFDRKSRPIFILPGDTIRIGERYL